MSAHAAESAPVSSTASVPQPHPPGTVPPSSRGTSHERVAARTETSRLLSRSMALTGTSQEMVARALGVSRSRVRNWCDVDDGDSNLALADLLVLADRLPRLFAEVMRQLAELADVTSDRGGELGHHALRLGAQAGRVAEVVSDALADGHVTSEEAHSIAREASKAEAAAAAVRRGSRRCR